MGKPFKVVDMRGNDLSHIEGIYDKYINDIKNLEEEYDVLLPAIKSVFVGKDFMPYTIIFLVNGMELYAKESLIPTKDASNKKVIETFKESLHGHNI